MTNRGWYRPAAAHRFPRAEADPGSLNINGAGRLESTGPIAFYERRRSAGAIVSVDEAERHVLERGDSPGFASLHMPKRGRRPQ